MRATKLFIIVSLFFLATEIAIADSVVASASVNWASATFSGPVAPTGAGGNPASPSEGIGAFYTTLSGVPIVSCAANAAGWTPIACSVQAGPDFVAASANSEFDAIAAASVGYSSNASVYRDGTIVVGANGDLNIETPFSATITPVVGSCGPSCNYFAQVEGAIFLFSTSPPPRSAIQFPGPLLLMLVSSQNRTAPCRSVEHWI